MCGICGLWSFQGDPVSAELIEKMNAQLVHRGPDDAGSLVRPGIALAMRRLTIIDLFTGSQPVQNEDGSISVVFNGEIFNYQDLRSELVSAGHVFISQSDTEVLVHGYEQWGEGLLNRLNGMFAFALWDSAKDELIVARDRLGKKPLYYWQGNGQLAFASEIKALLQIPGLNAAVEENALQLYLLLGFVPAPYTMFKGISKLEPGNLLRLRRSSPPQVVEYWNVQSAPDPNPSGNASLHPEETFFELFQDAVRLRMIADVPIGMLLSGGLDSSSVMAVMRLLGGADIKTFSVAFSEADINEASFARTAADAFGTDHYELLVHNCSPELFRKVVWHTDEPIADPALVPTYLLSNLASQHVKVVLTGEGADELFAGYYYHPEYKKTRWVDKLPMGLKPAYFVQAALAINKLLGRPRYHPRTLWSWTLPAKVRELAWTAIFTQPELDRFFSTSKRKALGKFDPFDFLAEIAHQGPSESWLTNLFRYDIRVPLVDDLLMKVDKMSMAASLEARTPFLDYRLVQFAGQLPEALKLDKDNNKLILRKTMQNILPKEISSRPKHPFHVPIRRWMKSDLNELFWDSLSSERFRAAQIIHPDSLNQLWNDLEFNTPGRAHQLWLLFSLALWADIYQVDLTPSAVDDVFSTPSLTRNREVSGILKTSGSF